jgi:hypothetical protein
MAKRGHRTTLDRVLLVITALFVLAGFIALGFLKNESQESRALLFMVSSVGMIGTLALLTTVNLFWRKLRRWTWQRAMAGWHRRYRMGSTPGFALPEPLTEIELRQLVLRTYSRIGYYPAGQAADDSYLRLINPEGRIELVACKQQPDPLALHEVYPLELEMKRTKAVRGFFWAPAGFTDDCMEWVLHRSIVLADRVEIGRLVDCAQTKGLRLLEQDSR